MQQTDELLMDMKENWIEYLREKKFSAKFHLLNWVLNICGGVWREILIYLYWDG